MDIILYIIKANLILALLCLLFQVLMHRDTFFGVRRLMLWSIYAAAFLLPLLSLQVWLGTNLSANNAAEAYAHYVLPTLQVTAERVALFGINPEAGSCASYMPAIFLLWGLLYLLPVVWMTLKFIWQIAYLIYLRCTCAKEIVQGQVVYSYPRPCSPFSFGPWIFIHTDRLDRQTLSEVLIHEQTHVHQWHTADVLFSHLVCILFWWNPATWVMRREVQLNLEFLADKAVSDYLTFSHSSSQTETSPAKGALKAYQYHLLGFSTQMNVATLANNFNVLPLKRRIIMMNLRRTRRAGMLKYVLFAPAAAALLWLSNVDALARTIEDNVKKPLTVINGQRATDAQVQSLPEEQIDHVSVLQSESAQQVFGPEARDGAVVIQTNGQSANDVTAPATEETPDGDDRIYEVVEHLPEYPGGQAALFEFLVKNMRYPAAAQEVGVQGKVMVRFVVETDGTISDVHATQVLDPNTGQALSELTVTAYSSEMTPEQAKQAEVEEKRVEGVKALKTESERVVKSLPGKWTPGRDKGKDVRVKFMLPISFRLQ